MSERKEEPEWKKQGFKSEAEYQQWRYENIPESQDYVFSNCGELGAKICVGQIEGDFLGEFENQVDANNAVREKAQREEFFPNVWKLSDHGNWHLLKEFNYEREIKEEKK